jgi:hypothetical protein
VAAADSGRGVYFDRDLNVGGNSLEFRSQKSEYKGGSVLHSRTRKHSRFMGEQFAGKKNHPGHLSPYLRAGY